MEEKFYERVAYKRKKKSVKNTETKKPAENHKHSNTAKTETKKSSAVNKSSALKKSGQTDAVIIQKQSLFETTCIPKDALTVIEDFDSIIQDIRPLNSHQLQQLPEQIRSLSHQMTDDRASRRLGYMNESIQLSAYVRYFTWWNLVRLSRLFSSLPGELFPQDDSICLDLGSGPLTVVIALWLARPELRNRRLTWYCLDLSQNCLSLGEDLFLSVASRLPGADENKGSEQFQEWKIIRVKGSFGTFIKQKADFITCANMFNEISQNNDMPPEFQTKKYYEQLKSYAADDARFLLIEPGVPKAARTLSLLRERFNSNGYSVVSPCPHTGECQMNGFKAYTGSTNKWCNFAFSTESAPKKLQKLSTMAKLPKERAVLSFICAVPNCGVENADSLGVRIASDGFRLPGNRTGHYACSSLGLTLIVTNDDILSSGDLLTLKLNKNTGLFKKDEKSGAVMIRL